MSLLVPGLGQLFQDRFLATVMLFLTALVLWFFWLGWIVHLLAGAYALLPDPEPRRVIFWTL